MYSRFETPEALFPAAQLYRAASQGPLHARSKEALPCPTLPCPALPYRGPVPLPLP
jgi:hypothetical protein